MSKHRCYGARYGSFLINSDSKSYRYGGQKIHKKCADTRRETLSFELDCEKFKNASHDNFKIMMKVEGRNLVSEVGRSFVEASRW